MEHWFWLGLMIFMTIWYVGVTLLVGIRGFGNIKSMLEEKQQE